MKTSLLLALFTTLAFSAQAKASNNCNLHIAGYNKLIGSDTALEASVRDVLQEKEIDLVEKSELQSGDFAIESLLKNYQAYGALPLHSYKMDYTNKIVYTRCFAFPLCSPLMNDKQVKDITGIDYKDSYGIKVSQGGAFAEVSQRKFNHSYRGELILDKKTNSYEGSPEHHDLVLAIAENVPKCSSLKKLIKN